ncbi:MAG TPA: UDP-N-acetylglucosamine 1-carboxyvinyltransferase [Armatimonadetes bacterium]|nr:UDP-N-acetylglucosamine 1-carboxyvinyltransferase [Armatimonadota bacterium]
MQAIVIRGGREARGEVDLSGSKNASLAILAAAMLAEDVSVIENVPDIADVRTMINVLESLGCKCSFKDGAVTVDARNLTSFEAPYHLVKRMRASFYAAGPLLARLGIARVPLPGGCVLGSRPVNFHIDGFEALGAKVDLDRGCVEARAERLKGAFIYLDPRFCSVGATVNIAMAASLAEGTTVIENAAKEPEVQEFCRVLNKMGAKVEGIGTGRLIIHGRRRLHGFRHKVMNDRIEAGTYLLAAPLTGGEVKVGPIDPSFLELPLKKLAEAGVEVERGPDWIRARARGRPKGIHIVTLPYPGFPTDLHPPFVAMMAVAEGASVVRETIYEGRWGYVDELRRMGARITVEDKVAVIEGVGRLKGAPVEAPDIRAGAALVLAGLNAEGETVITGIEHIDRGYERIEEKFASLGVDIERLEVTEGEPCSASTLG